MNVMTTESKLLSTPCCLADTTANPEIRHLRTLVCLACAFALLYFGIKCTLYKITICFTQNPYHCHLKVQIVTYIFETDLIFANSYQNQCELEEKNIFSSEYTTAHDI